MGLDLTKLVDRPRGNPLDFGKPTETQREVLQHFKNGKKIVLMVAGRQSGKSHLGARWLILQTMNPHAKDKLAFAIAPTYQMARVIERKIQEVLKLDPVLWKQVEYRAGPPPTYTFPNGWVIEVRSADNPDCYDDETEILTRDGWKLFEALSEGEDVMTLNPKTLEAEWQTPTAHIYAEYTGPMKTLKSRAIDLRVTPNHKFFVKKRYSGEYEFTTLDEAKVNDTIPSSVRWEGSGGDKYSDDLMAFLGLFVAEGYASGPARTAKGNYEVVFAQTPGPKGGTKGDVRRDFLEVLDRLDFKYTEYPDVIKLYGKKYHELVAGWGLAHEKRVPREIMDLPPEKLQIFLEWAVKGDGTMRGDDWTYYTTSEGLAGDIQEIAMKLGMTGRVTIKPQAGPVVLDGRVLSNFRTLYQVNLSRSKSLYLGDSEGSYISEEMYSGGVYCVEVPNGVVYVRRRGKPAWSGNSLRGPTISAVWFDEVAAAEEYAFDVIMPTLLANDGSFLGTTTPRGVTNWIYDRIYLKSIPPGRAGHDEFAYNEGYATVTGSTWANVENLNPDAIKMLEDQYGKDSAFGRQEIAGEFVSYEGLVYRWDAHNSMAPMDMPKLEEFSQIVGGIDFGWTDPASAYVMGYRDGVWYVVDGFYGSHIEPNDFALRLAALTDTYKVMNWYADSARPELIADLNSRGLPVLGVKKPRVEDRIREMAMFADNNRLKISTGCPDVIREITSYKWPERPRRDSTGAVKPQDENDHSLDAIGYAIYSMRWLWRNEVDIGATVRRRDDSDTDYEDIQFQEWKRKNNLGRRRRRSGPAGRIGR